MIAPHIAKWALDRQQRKADDSERVAAIAAHAPEIGVEHKKRKHVDVEERVLETKGGGGYQPPPQPTPMQMAEAREWEAKMEFDREQRREEAQRERDLIEKEAADAAWLTSKNAAYEGALTSGADKLRGLGIVVGDPSGVYESFTNRINTANQALTPGADYSGSFSPTILDEILGSARTGQRNKYSTEFGGLVDPYFAEDQFGGTADDAILASILDTQYQDALTDLQAARDRGQATTSVYDRALRDLDTAKYAANTELQGTGRGILEDIVGDINARRQTALDTAGSWDFGTTYDPTAEASRLRSYAGERKAGLEGDIRGAVGGKEFFDINSLLGKAKAKVGNQTTGADTTGSSALYDTFENEATKKASDIKTGEGVF